MFGSGQAAQTNGYGGLGAPAAEEMAARSTLWARRRASSAAAAAAAAYTGGQAGQTGGFGGGGGGTGNYTDYPPAGKGGWGGSDGDYVVGGSGAGLGGAVFVQQGGSLTFGGNLGVSGNSAIGGLGQNVNGGTTKNGLGAGAGLFLQGNGSLVFNPGAGQVQVVNDTIADQNGVPLDAGGNRVGPGGSWSLVKNGEGTTILFGSTATRIPAESLSMAAYCRATPSLCVGTSTTTPRSSSISMFRELSPARSPARAHSPRPITADLTLTGANTYSGGTTIERRYNSGGVLRFTTDSNLGAAGKPITFSDAGGEIGTTTAHRAGATINRPINILGSKEASTSPSIRSPGAGLFRDRAHSARPAPAISR